MMLYPLQLVEESRELGKGHMSVNNCIRILLLLV